MASIPDGFQFSKTDFSGRVRLFPLPNLVLYPHVLRPLHIFEPRYRAMLEDALASDALVAMALLAPGWEPDYEGRPPLYPAACLGGVTTHARLDDGTYNLLLHGLRRIRLIRELPPDKLYREAEVEVLEDEYPAETAADRPRLRRQLVQCFKELLRPSSTQVISLGAGAQLPAGQTPAFEELLDGQLPLGVLTDVMAYALDLSMPMKEQLLGQTNVDTRAATLVAEVTRLRGQDTPRPDFPPKFSPN